MEEEEWIERSLCDADRARSACKVIITERNAVVAKGDNYTSELSRLKMKVLLYSGEVEERSVIYKCLPSTELMRKYIRDTGLFTTERRMYSDVLPKMEKIRREFESGEPLWGECYAVHGYESFLLQDLQVLGYKMGERIKGLDFEHCCFVMQSLAKFHALAAVLKERGQIILSDYDKYFIERNFSMMGTFYNSSFEGLCKTVENEFGEEWQPILEKLRKLSKTVSEEILKVVALNKKHKFNTLNHGDCWVNNMLFKYGPDEKPISTRFIDFQISFYNHVGFDLQYFLSTSPTLETRPQIPELIRIYQDSLSGFLTKYKYSGEIPTLDDVLEDYKRVAVYGLANSISLLNLMKRSSEDAPDIEKTLKEFEENKELGNSDMSSFFKNSDEYIAAMKCVLKEAEKNGVF